MITHPRINRWAIVIILGVVLISGVLAVARQRTKSRAVNSTTTLSITPSPLSQENVNPGQGASIPEAVLPNTGAIQIGRYDTLELVFTAASSPANPFDTYLLKIELTDPTGRKFQIDGFFDGDGKGGQNGKIWKARITPDIAGTWSWRTVEGDQPDKGLANLSGQFEAIANENPGGVIADGKYFSFQNGDTIYLMGNFLDFGNGLRTTQTFMSETTSDSQRNAIILRQRDFHAVNKANIFIANKGDYNNQSVTPWLGSAADNDKSKMDLARWKKYDQYILRLKSSQILAELWFFADDSNYGDLSQSEMNRLARYTMARTSAFSHTLYVLSLEWQEAFSAQEVQDFGAYVHAHNPWKRLVSVHGLELSDWPFVGQEWASFVALQPGNDSPPDTVFNYTNKFTGGQNLPVLAEEFGHLNGDSDKTLRSRMWAAFTAGSAGLGTGSDLKAFQRFLEQSRAPFQRMRPANTLVSEGGKERFALAEQGHHYLVYSSNGSFTLEVSGSGLIGRWFNPRDPSASLSKQFPVSSGTQTFNPPNDNSLDWVLWVTDSSKLLNGVTHPQPGNPMVCVPVQRASLSSEDLQRTEVSEPSTANLIDVAIRLFLPLTTKNGAPKAPTFSCN